LSRKAHGQADYDIRNAGRSVTIIHGNKPAALEPVIDACDAFVANYPAG
jgi:hypothetical protein